MYPLIWTLVAPFFFTSTPAVAIWPFESERFTTESLINAGKLGLDDVTGRVVALGDWNGDSNTDLFILSEDEKSVRLYTWDRSRISITVSWRYIPSKHTITLSHPIKNVIPADWNYDGRLDLLVMYDDSSRWGDGKLGMKVYLQGSKGEFAVTSSLPVDSNWEIPELSEVQGLVFDAEGTLRPSLLGFSVGTKVLQSWTNIGTGLSIQPPPLQYPDQACSFANPHSSAFIDLNGDCSPDLVLHCTRPRSAHHKIQIWINSGTAGYTLSRDYDLPKGSGPLTFADMNRDGNLDIVFPICDKLSSSSGVGTDCKIAIAYNQQVPLCSSEGSQLDRDGKLQCRGWGELCTPDPDFAFSFEQSSPFFTYTSLESLFPGGRETPGILLHPPNEPMVMLPLRAGDFNLDGYPDLLLTIQNATAAPSSGVFGSKVGTQVRVLENISCKKGVAGCESARKGGRGLRVASGVGWEVLDEMWDAQGASWLDLDDDGSLDIMVHRSGSQGEGKVTFIRNNFYHDAFFLKAQVLNGACDGVCNGATGSKHSGTGVGYSGASFKFTVLDTLGRRGAQHVAQLPQTGYHALGAPYSFIGLGRTNNYVERLSVGTSLHPPLHYTNLESIIPNSQILVNPPGVSNYTVPGRSINPTWQSELFLHPGDWIPYVAAAVFGMVIILGGVVISLNEKEKKEDEMERRRALHAINFQAL